MSPPPPPMLRRVVLTLAAVVVAIGGGHALLRYLEGLKKEPERKAGGPPLPVVRVVEVRRQDHREVLRGYGVARAMREAQVSAEVRGVVRAVSPELEVGNLVAPPAGGLDGEGAAAADARPLVVLDRQDLEDQLAGLAAEGEQALADKERLRTAVANYDKQLEVIQRRLDTARTELRRILVLVPDTLPESDADRQRLAVFALEQVESELVQRKEEALAGIAGVDARLHLVAANERKSRRDLGRTRIHAPFAGRVAARHVEVGTLVAPGTPLFDVVDATRVEVGIDLPASRYGQVRDGGSTEGASRVTLRRGEGGEPVWEGVVARIAPRVDADARTFRVYVEIASTEADVPVPPGTHVVGDVEGASYADVLPVPREAFVDDRVYVAEAGDGNAVARERRPLVRAQLVGISLVEPTEDDEGLKDGERVVVSNLEDIADGSRIRLIETPAGDEGP